MRVLAIAGIILGGPSVAAAETHGWVTSVPFIDTMCESVPEPRDPRSPTFRFDLSAGIRLRGPTDVIYGWSVAGAGDPVSMLRQVLTAGVRRWLGKHGWTELGAGTLRVEVGAQKRAQLGAGQELFVGVGDSYPTAPGSRIERALRLSVASGPDDDRIMIDFTLGSGHVF